MGMGRGWFLSGKNYLASRCMSKRPPTTKLQQANSLLYNAASPGGVSRLTTAWLSATLVDIASDFRVVTDNVGTALLRGTRFLP